MNPRIIPVCITALLLTACVTAPKPLQGQFSPISPNASVVTEQQGAYVRWGGQIIQTTPSTNETCFEVIARPLSNTGKPSTMQRDSSDGRFLACRAGFFDPAIFTPGRDITVVGKINELTQSNIGEFSYRLPKLAADVVFLWPEEPTTIEVRTGPLLFNDPFWGPSWHPRWGWRRW